MRVWIVNHYAIEPKQAGGTRHYNLARELVKRGHDVVIIASSFDHGTRMETKLREGESAKKEVVDGVQFLWLRTPPYSGNSLARVRNMTAFSGRVLRKCRSDIIDAPDVIVGSSPHLFAAWAAKHLANHHGVPFVLEVRDLWPESLVQLGRMSSYHPVILAFRRIERYLYRQADRIIAVLPGIAKYLDEWGLDSSKVVWIPNGVDLSQVPTFPHGEHRLFTLMYAGSHGLANALDPIVEAAGLLQRRGWGDKLCIRMIGDGPEKKRLQAKADAERISILSFESPVPKEQVFETLQEADAFIVSMADTALYKWGISLNKVFDYLACARPIIMATNSPYNQVEAAKAGITVPPMNSEALADAISHLAQLPHGELKTMGEHGREYVRKFHNIEQLGAEVERVLIDVINKQNSG